MSTPLDSLKEQLAHLNADDLKELLAEGSYRLKSAPTKNKKEITIEESIVLDKKQEQVTHTDLKDRAFFYNALSDELKKRTGQSGLNFQLFMNTGSYKAFDVCFMYLDLFVKELKINKMGRTAVKRAYLLIARILADRVNNRKIPLSIRAMCNQGEYIPGLFDLAFPGYARSGLVKVLLSKKAA